VSSTPPPLTVGVWTDARLRVQKVISDLGPLSLNGQVALSLAALGWYIVPLCSPNQKGRCGCGGGHRGNQVGKAPVTKLVPRGFKDSTRDLEVIHKWWKEYPEANVGIDLGRSGVIAVDLDSEEATAYVVSPSRGLPPTVVRESARSAVLYRRPDGLEPRNVNKIEGVSGLEILAKGILVVWGIHRTGCSVSLLPELPRPEDCAECPEWVIQLLHRPELPNSGPELAESDASIDSEFWQKTKLNPTEQAVLAGRLAYQKDSDQLVDPSAAKIDRSRTLFLAGAICWNHGMSRQEVAATVRELDRSLGFNKYSTRRNGDIEYERIARKVTVQKPRNLKRAFFNALGKMVKAVTEWSGTPTELAAELKRRTGLSVSPVWVGRWLQDKACPVAVSRTRTARCRRVVLRSCDSNVHNTVFSGERPSETAVSRYNYSKQALSIKVEGIQASIVLHWFACLSSPSNCLKRRRALALHRDASLRRPKRARCVRGPPGTGLLRRSGGRPLRLNRGPELAPGECWRARLSGDGECATVRGWEGDVYDAEVQAQDWQAHIHGHGGRPASGALGPNPGPLGEGGSHTARKARPAGPADLHGRRGPDAGPARLWGRPG
jgi:hypothetical protein